MNGRPRTWQPAPPEYAPLPPPGPPAPAPVPYPHAPTGERPGRSWIIATFVLLGVGVLLALQGDLGALVLSMPLFVAAVVTGIVGAVVSYNHRRTPGMDGQSAAGAVGGAVGLGAALIVLVVVILTIIAMIVATVMRCLFSFGFAC